MYPHHESLQECSMDRTLLREHVETFFASPAFAVIGVSANRKKFGNVVYRSMKERGLTVFPVHPSLTTVEGDACYRAVRDLPDNVKSVITVVQPAVTEQVVEECADKGIRSVWMQQGSQSDSAISAATSHGMSVVPDECVMMYLEPVKSVHAFHRWVTRLVGKYAA